jgi:hypothetical protein
MNKKELIERVRALALPRGQYVVFGSGPMAAHGIRLTRDIDILVTTALYERLKKEGWEVAHWDSGAEYLAKGIFEVDDSWNYEPYNPKPEEIISIAEIIDGIPFAPLREVLKWKKAFGREKDKVHIRLLEAYLASNA